MLEDLDSEGDSISLHLNLGHPDVVRRIIEEDTLCEQQARPSALELRANLILTKRYQ